jgi:hypothetical protein
VRLSDLPAGWKVLPQTDNPATYQEYTYDGVGGVTGYIRDFERSSRAVNNFDQNTILDLHTTLYSFVWQLSGEPSAAFDFARSLEQPTACDQPAFSDACWKPNPPVGNEAEGFRCRGSKTVRAAGDTECELTVWFGSYALVLNLNGSPQAIPPYRHILVHLAQTVIKRVASYHQFLRAPYGV